MKNLVKYENLILAAFYILMLIFFVAFRYDFYFALNDDVLMKDLLAGIYTGTPEASNIQMLYPLGFVISLFYRIVPGFPWYGLFLIGCQFLSLYMISFLSLKFSTNRIKKILFLIVMFVIFFATMLHHLVFVQYTITSAMLAAAAVFYFTVTEASEDIKVFIKANIPALILILIAFLLRPWMLWLLLPLICFAGIFKWSQEVTIFTKQNMKKYFSLFGLLLALLLVSQAIDLLAHSSSEWRQFNRFFANRTKLYDFQMIPEYEENAAFYTGIGFTYGEVNLLNNYNFGISEKINDVSLLEIATYAKQKRNETVSFGERFKQQFRAYYYVATKGHYPYNVLILLGYAALLGWAFFRNQLGRIVTVLFMLGIVRSGLWLYILMGERYPERIIHSLYFVEMMLLLAMFLTAMTKKEEQDSRKVPKFYPYIVAVTAVFIAFGNIKPTLYGMDTEFIYIEAKNQPWRVMQEYVSKNNESFYFIDVYSSVKYQEDIFGFDNPFRSSFPANYDIMGGWAVNSPLHQKKLDRMIKPGITMFEALYSYDNVFFINDKSRDTSWLPAYYAERGYEISLERVDVIADKLEVYKLR